MIVFTSLQVQMERVSLNNQNRERIELQIKQKRKQRTVGAYIYLLFLAGPWAGTGPLFLVGPRTGGRGAFLVPQVPYFQPRKFMFEIRSKLTSRPRVPAPDTEVMGVTPVSKKLSAFKFENLTYYLDSNVDFSLEITK